MMNIDVPCDNEQQQQQQNSQQHPTTISSNITGSSSSSCSTSAAATHHSTAAPALPCISVPPPQQQRLVKASPLAATTTDTVGSTCSNLHSTTTNSPVEHRGSGGRFHRKGTNKRRFLFPAHSRQNSSEMLAVFLGTASPSSSASSASSSQQSSSSPCLTSPSSSLSTTTTTTAATAMTDFNNNIVNMLKHGCDSFRNTHTGYKLYYNLGLDASTDNVKVKVMSREKAATIALAQEDDGRLTPYNASQQQQPKAMIESRDREGDECSNSNSNAMAMKNNSDKAITFNHIQCTADDCYCSSSTHVLCIDNCSNSINHLSSASTNEQAIVNKTAMMVPTTTALQTHSTSEDQQQQQLQIQNNNNNNSYRQFIATPLPCDCNILAIKPAIKTVSWKDIYERRILEIEIDKKQSILPHHGSSSCAQTAAL